MKLLNNKRVVGVVIGVVSAIVAVPAVYAQAATEITQQINPGVLSTDVRNSSNVVVPAPTFAMSAATVMGTTQTVTGTFGSASQRISVNNPGAANGGWTLSLNATTPGTGAWTSGSNTYPYNGTTTTGQLTVNPVAGTITALQGGSTGVNKGTQATFTGSTGITLMSADAASADIWNGYITGIGLSQIIPANTPAGSYKIDLTQTVVTN